MDCFHDFCLACDKQSNGPYCSQTCRLADLERGNVSAPTSPTSSSPQQQMRLSWTSSTSSSGSAYVLPLAYDFSEKVTSPAQKTTNDELQRDCYFMRSPAQQSSTEAAVMQRSLTPSSSRSSLSSSTSEANAPSAGGLSHQAQLELQEYFNSFHSAKASKRRPSLR